MMNKGGGTGLGSVSGPTAAAAAAAAQKQKVLLQRVDTDIGNIIDNFSQLVNVARVRMMPFTSLIFPHLLSTLLPTKPSLDE